MRAAEAQLHQASAQIGVAIANRLPQFTLTGDYGSAALTPAALFTPSTIIWSIAGERHAADFPRRHAVCISSAPPKPPTTWRRRNTAPRCWRAFQNVADALRALQTRRRDAEGAASAPCAPRPTTLDLSRSQYRLGAITYVILLNAQRSYQQARLALVQAQAARYADTAALFQALGGGWWNRVDVAPDPLSPEADPIDGRPAPTRSPARSAGEPCNDQAHGDHAGGGRPSCSAASSDSRRSRPP